MTGNPIFPSLRSVVRSSGALVFSASLVSLAALATGACGSSSNGASTAPNGSAAAAGDSNQPSGGTAGSGTSGGTTSGGTTGKGGSGSGAATSGGSSSGGSSATGGSGATLGNGGDGTTIGNGGSTTTTNTACDNGIDDDGDGLVDGLDPECTGAFDQDEGSFATGIPGDNQDPKWQDCFFDGNSGGGDDGCRYPTSCLLGDTAADDSSCELAQNCIDYCARLTPNGCDCFGCCTVEAADGTSVDIFTVSTCSLDNLSDEDACPRCQKSIACDNPCGECEICPGKTEADLPASCTPPPPTGEGGNGGAPDGTGGTSGTGGSPSTGGTGGTGGTTDTPPPVHTCDGGEQVCGTGLPRCGTGLYCQLGCCMPSVR
jgi:hypothetical protein